MWFACATCRRRIVATVVLAGADHEDLALAVLDHFGEPPMCDTCAERT